MEKKSVLGVHRVNSIPKLDTSARTRRVRFIKERGIQGHRDYLYQRALLKGTKWREQSNLCKWRRAIFESEFYPNVTLWLRILTKRQLTKLHIGCLGLAYIARLREAEARDL